MDTRQIHITKNQGLALMRAARAEKIVRAVPVDLPHIACPPQHLASLDDLHIDDLLSWLGITRSNRLEVLVPNAKARYWMQDVHASVLSQELPSGSLLELVQVPNEFGSKDPRPLRWDPNTRVFIDAPPLALIHASASLEALVTKGAMSALEALLRIIALSCECCGSYARNPLNPMSESAHFDKPGTCNRFMTPQQLRTALNSMNAYKGLVRARMAARHTLDFSGSPMETYVDSGLFLPPRLGGTSLLMPLFNQSLTVTDEERERMRHRSLRPDMHWPEQRVLAEYYGDKEHADLSARREDKNRIQDYGSTNYKPFVLMYDDVKSIEALNKTAEMLVRALVDGGAKGELHRLRRTMRIKGFRDKQKLLAKVMLPALAHY